MDALKHEILQRLDVVPDNKLQEVLSFLDFLIWQNKILPSPEDKNWLDNDLSNLGSYEPYEWQEGELQEGLPVKFVAETGNIEIGI
jgi:hypothetical protein